MIHPVSNTAQVNNIASKLVKAKDAKPEASSGASKPSPSTHVTLSAAAQAAAEATETAAQTAHEASHGDSQARRLQAREAAAKVHAA